MHILAHFMHATFLDICMCNKQIHVSTCEHAGQRKRFPVEQGGRNICLGHGAAVEFLLGHLCRLRAARVQACAGIAKQL